NGDAYTDFDLYGLSVTDHLAVILSAAPAYFFAGTVDSTAKVDLAYRAYSPLQALRQLAAAIPGGAEIELIPNGSLSYLIGIRTRVGASAPKVFFRYNRNLNATRRGLDVTGQPSRVLPVGMDVEGRRFDMGDAAWEIDSIAGSLVTLKGTPIAFDDQLNGLYAQKSTGGTLRLINDSQVLPPRLDLANVTGLAPGDRLNVRRNAAGAELLQLDRPGASRIRTAVLERPDIPPVDNLVMNSFLSSWSAGMPVNWAKVGTPTVSQVTDPLYHRWGLASAQVVCLAEEEGLETDWIPVNPTDGFPFFGAQISLWVAEGVIRFEIVAEDAGAVNTYVIPDDAVTGGRAYTSVIGQWIDRLAIQDQATNFKELGIVRAKLRILADRLDGTSGQASFYLDAAQLARTHLPDLPFFEGLASNALWDAANAELKRWLSPPTKLTVDLVDLYRIDPQAFPHDGLVLGGAVRVDDTTMGIAYDTRILKLVEELAQEGATQVELSEKPDEFTNLVAEPQLDPRRNGTLLPRGTVGAVDGNPRLDEDYDKLYLFPQKDTGAKSVRYVSSATPIVEADVLASGLTSDDEQILVHTFSTDREQRWVGVAYYPASGGAGKVGRVHILPPWTFFTRNNRPLLEWQTFPTARPSVVRIGLAVTDDGDNVAFYYRYWTDGGSPPAFTRSPSSGYVSDPYEAAVDVTRPAADGDPDVIFEAYGVDDDGNESQLIRLRIRKSMVLQETPRVFPELDEDGDELYLVWQPNIGAQRIQWLTDLVDEPTLVEVQASSNFDSTGKVLVHTFDPNGPATQQAFIGFIPQSAADGGGTRDAGALVVLPYTYRPGNDRPRITHTALGEGDPGVERVVLNVSDDGDQVALYYRTYVKGATPPAYTRTPSSGYVSDPLSQVVSFTKPAEGAANQVIEAYAVDDTSPDELESELFYLESDGDDVPTGSFEVAIDPDTGVVRVIPTTGDSDAESYRFRVKKTTAADDSYNVPSFNDAATDEFKGTAFGTPVVLSGYALVKGERLNVYGWFFRTTTATATAQGSSTKSEPVTNTQYAVDQTPGFSSLSIGFDDAGKVLVTWQGNQKFVQGYINVGIGSAPGIPSAGSHDAAIAGLTGTAKFDGGTFPSRIAAIGEKVFVRGVAENAAGVVGPTTWSAERRRGDSDKVPPRIRVTVVRSGSVVACDLTIDDPSKSVTAVEFRKREDGGSLSGYGTGWDRSSGTPGSSTSITRGEDVISSHGLDSQFVFRVSFTDELGATQIKEDTINVSRLEAVYKPLKIPHTDLMPALNTYSWIYGSAAVTPGANGAVAVFVGSIVLPAGVIVTDWVMRASRADASNDIVSAQILKISDSGTVATTICTLTHSGTGWNDTADSTDENISDDHTYVVAVTMKGQSVATDAKFGRLELTYLAPSYDKTY
ncbi:MAG: hypothetical protein AB7G12_17515, partial [Thermoanaerobaculia bacterium]